MKLEAWQHVCMLHICVCVCVSVCVCVCGDHFMVRIRQGQVRYLVSCDLLIARFPTLITSLYHPSH